MLDASLPISLIKLCIHSPVKSRFRECNSPVFYICSVDWYNGKDNSYGKSNDIPDCRCGTEVPPCCERLRSFAGVLSRCAGSNAGARDFRYPVPPELWRWQGQRSGDAPDYRACGGGTLLSGDRERVQALVTKGLSCGVGRS